jgi:hypothetical protein
MLIIPGSIALSDFRTSKLLADLKTVEPGILSVSARFVHFVDQEGDLQDNELSILKQLLDYGSESLRIGIRRNFRRRQSPVSHTASRNHFAMVKQGD